MALQEFANDAGHDQVMDELQPGTPLLHGQYTITRFLNNGGFGITYLAKDSLERNIVIKECFPGAFCRRSRTIVCARSRAHKAELDSIIRLFVQEARSLSKLIHPNIVGVHQVFEDNDTAYMAIDYVDGKDLLDIIEEDEGSLTPGQIADITRKLLEAIKFVHDRGILHRDISPDNILINSSGEPILIDFGAAREHAANTKRALSALRVVKDGYSPQEFYIAGSEQGPWSDLYALAASIYHVIKGEAPVNGQNRLAAIAEKRDDPYEQLAGNVDGYPNGFLEAIDMALNTLPKERLQSAGEWLDMLDHPPEKPMVVDGDPVAAISQLLEDVQGGADGTGANGRPDFTTSGRKKQRRTIHAGKERFPELLDDQPHEEVQQTEASRRKEISRLRAGAGFVLGASLGIFAMQVSSSGYTAQDESAAMAIEATQPATSGAESPMVPGFDAPVGHGTDAPAGDAAAADEEAALDIDAGYQTALLDAAWLHDDADEIPYMEAAIALDVPPMVTEPSDLFDTVDSRRATLMPLPLEREAENAGVAATGIQFAALTEGETVSVTDDEAAETTIKVVSVAPSTAASTPDQEARTVSAVSATPLLQNQIAFAHWDVDMPFRSSVRRVRNADIALITEVAAGADLDVSGAWIDSGTVIYTVNGEPLDGRTTVAAHLLNNLSVDPDGYTRATVRFKDMSTGQFDRGLLAVPVVRNVGLAAGPLIEVRTRDGAWTATVRETASEANDGLRAGDVLLRETVTGRFVDDPDAMEEVLETLVKQKSATAEFEVMRGGQMVLASLNLVAVK